MSKKSIQISGPYGISLYIPNDVVTRESCNSFLKNLIITQIGYFQKAAGHSIARSGIHEYILIYCIDGNGWIETYGKRREVSAGDLVFCDKNRPHAYGADNINPWTIHWVHFIGEGVPEISRVLGISEHSPILQIGKKDELISMISDAYKILSNGYSFSNLFYASTRFQEFFCYTIKYKMYSGLQNMSGNDIEDVIKFMLKNIHTVFTLKQLADYMKMSKYHFARRFKEIMGYSPIEYFNRLKIQKACELLYTSSLDVKEISDALGFSNAFYFSEVFKRIIGVSPRKYRSLQQPTPLSSHKFPHHRLQYPVYPLGQE